MKNIKLDDSVFVCITHYGKKKTAAFSFSAVSTINGEILETKVCLKSDCHCKDEYQFIYAEDFCYFITKYKCRGIQGKVENNIFYDSASNSHITMSLKYNLYLEELSRENTKIDKHNYLTDRVLINEASVKNVDYIFDEITKQYKSFTKFPEYNNGLLDVGLINKTLAFFQLNCNN
jgi:hypothetical protein